MSENMKALQEKLVAAMKEWQEIESKAIDTTRSIADKSDNPLIKNIMVTINSDSARHRSVQQFIVDSLEKEYVEINIQDMENVWNMIEEHIELEKQMAAKVEEMLAALEGKKSFLVQHYLLEYLREDERKHEIMLNNLGAIKTGMYPYGG